MQSAWWSRRAVLREDGFYHLSVNVGETELATLKAEGKSLVIDAQ